MPKKEKSFIESLQNEWAAKTAYAESQDFADDLAAVEKIFREAHDQGMDDSKIMENIPEELADRLADAVFHAHMNEAKREKDSKFPTYRIRKGGLDFFLVIGQGSFTYIRKASGAEQMDMFAPKPTQ